MGFDVQRDGQLQPVALRRLDVPPAGLQVEEQELLREGEVLLQEPVAGPPVSVAREHRLVRGEPHRPDGLSGLSWQQPQLLTLR